MKQIIFLLIATFISPTFAINPDEEALFNAVQAGDIKKVEALINYVEGITYRVSMNIKNKDGDTPLIIAVKKNNTSLTEKLLKRKQDISIQDKYGETALTIAIKQMPPMVKILLEQGLITNIDSQGKNGNTPLILAVNFKNINIIEEILKEVPRTDIKNNEGKTAMDIARAMPETSEKEKVLKEKIIKLVAQAQIQDQFETAVKKITLQQKQKPTIDALEEFIKQGASVNIPRNENNPLYRAVRWNELSLVELLIKHNVDINQRTKEGEIPLVTAASYSGPEIVKALLQKGANPNSIDSGGMTPLINVIIRIFSKPVTEKDSGFAIFQQLIAAGADPLMQNPYGKTAFDLAKEYQKLSATPPNTSGLDENEKKKREERYQQQKQNSEKIVQLLESEIQKQKLVISALHNLTKTLRVLQASLAAK